MINYALFTNEQISQMAAHGATAEIRDRAKAEQLIRQQEQEIFDLRQKLTAANQRIAALEGELENARDAADAMHRVYARAQ